MKVLGSVKVLNNATHDEAAQAIVTAQAEGKSVFIKCVDGTVLCYKAGMRGLGVIIKGVRTQWNEFTKWLETRQGQGFKATVLELMGWIKALIGKFASWIVTQGEKYSAEKAEAALATATVK